jgi:carbon-monoxide dehydrogenase medium subunit
MGTIGGNICMAGPSQDTQPVLLALGAKLTLTSLEGERVIPVEDFFIGPFKTAIMETELLTQIRVPPLTANTMGSYQWINKINAVDETLAGVAVVMKLGEESVCEDIKIGLCSVAPTPMRAFRAEEAIKGRRLESRLIKEAAEAAMEESKPRSRGAYRRRMVGILLTQTMNDVWQRIEEKMI